MESSTPTFARWIGDEGWSGMAAKGWSMTKRQLPSACRRTTSAPAPAISRGWPSGPVPRRVQRERSSARSPASTTSSTRMSSVPLSAAKPPTASRNAAAPVTI